MKYGERLVDVGGLTLNPLMLIFSTTPSPLASTYVHMSNKRAAGAGM